MCWIVFCLKSDDTDVYNDVVEACRWPAVGVPGIRISPRVAYVAGYTATLPSAT